MIKNTRAMEQKLARLIEGGLPDAETLGRIEAKLDVIMTQLGVAPEAPAEPPPAPEPPPPPEAEPTPVESLVEETQHRRSKRGG